MTLNSYTQWYWKTDLLNLLNFLFLRADSHAQYEIRVYAEAMLDTVKKWVPITHAAFLDYRVGAVHVSAKGKKVIQLMAKGDKVSHESSGLSKRDWIELKEALPIRSSEKAMFSGLARGVVPEDQMRQWQPARYYFMDVIVMGEEPRPSVEAAELGFDIDQVWIDEHCAQLHEEWEQLWVLCKRALNQAEQSLLDQQTLRNK